MNKIIFNLLLISVLILSSCSQNTKVYSNYYYGVVNIESNNILLNIFENKKYVQYKLIFNGKDLVKQFVKEITEDEYDYSYQKWGQQLTKNILYSGNPYSKEPPKEYLKILAKKIDDIEIEQFDRAENDICISLIQIKIKNKLDKIIIKNTNIFDFTVIKTNNKNYLVILQGAEGSGSFSSIVDIYKLN
jgi:hypothetical protein